MENRRNNIVRALRAEQDQNVGDGRNKFRRDAFNKHIRAIETYPEQIKTMNNVEKAYNTAIKNDGTKLFNKGMPDKGRPVETVLNTILFPTHHIRSIPMEPSLMSRIPSPRLPSIPVIRRRSVKQVPREDPKVISRRSVKQVQKQVQKQVLPKDKRRAQSVKNGFTGQNVQKGQKGQKGQKDYKKDILIRLLELQAIEHGNGKDDRRKKAFQRHINAIMKYPYEIETIEDLRTIYRKAHLPTHGIAYKAIHKLIPLRNITRRKQVVYQPSSFL